MGLHLSGVLSWSRPFFLCVSFSVWVPSITRWFICAARCLWSAVRFYRQYMWIMDHLRPCCRPTLYPWASVLDVCHCDGYLLLFWEIYVGISKILQPWDIVMCDTFFNFNPGWIYSCYSSAIEIMLWMAWCRMPCSLLASGSWVQTVRCCLADSGALDVTKLWYFFLDNPHLHISVFLMNVLILWCLNLHINLIFCGGLRSLLEVLIMVFTLNCMWVIDAHLFTICMLWGQLTSNVITGKINLPNKHKA